VGTDPDIGKWNKVKLHVLEGAFKSSPGALVAYSGFGVRRQNFERDHSMQVKYSFKPDTDKSKMFLVQKDEWSLPELVDIATKSVYFSSNTLWMLPNTHKIMPLYEAEKVGKFLCDLSSLNFDSEFLDEGYWETVGCIYNEEMTWTNPSLYRADMVVDNLKKLCSEHKIEFEEM